MPVRGKNCKLAGWSSLGVFGRTEGRQPGQWQPRVLVVHRLCRATEGLQSRRACSDLSGQKGLEVGEHLDVCCRLKGGRNGGVGLERFQWYFSLSCTEEGNGNPLQCSCLENPRDGSQAV